MNPQMFSVLTSLLKDGVTALGVWAVAHGIIPAGDQTNFVNYTVGLLLIAASQGVTYYKQKQVTPAALVEKVNAGDNGVKVVSAATPETVAPTVEGPLK